MSECSHAIQAFAGRGRRSWLALLCAAALWPGPFAYPAALALAATAGLLEINLLIVVRAYRDNLQKMRAQSAAKS